MQLKLVDKPIIELNCVIKKVGILLMLKIIFANNS